MFTPPDTLPLAFARRTLHIPAHRPAVMGIINITPDSFSDAGCHNSVKLACAHADNLVRQGADLLDIGGESTRPGAQAIPADIQISRVVPVLRALREKGLEIPISIDTRCAQTAQEALRAGADMVNDVSAASDPAMPAVLLRAQAPVILTHMRGTPQTMQLGALDYADVVQEVGRFLRARTAQLVDIGLPPRCVWVDPGLGFGKTCAHNLALTRHLGALSDIAGPVVYGASRKRFIGELVKQPIPARRDVASAILSAYAWQQGAHIVRVHNVDAVHQALRVQQALANLDTV